MSERIYIYQMDNHFIANNDKSGGTHRLARKFFTETYLEKYKGIRLYSDMTIRYEDWSYDRTVEILAAYGHTFIIDQNPLYQDDDGITFTIDSYVRESLFWLRPEFAEKYAEDRRYWEIANTYSFWDIIKNLFVLREDVSNKSLKHVLEIP